MTKISVTKMGSRIYNKQPKMSLAVNKTVLGYQTPFNQQFSFLFSEGYSNLGHTKENNTNSINNK